MRNYAGVCALVAVSLLVGCDPNQQLIDSLGCTTDDTLCGSIDGDLVLASNKTWTIDGDVFVTGGTLTIEPGTTLVSKGGALIIARGAKINAVGTASQPIVFTSSEAPGDRAPGDWKGLVLLGNATINVAGGNQTIEGFASGSDARADYGGTDDAHDCGKVKYTRLEFTGFKLANGNELQGLTMGGCGSQTEIDYVQSHLSTDDGIEIFGGTVDLKHAVITGADDDGLDWDFGWSGKAGFVVVQQWPNRGNCGIEADNNEKDFDAAPRSAPELWNVTLIGRPTGGSEKSCAMTLRRGTAGKIFNSIAINFADQAIDINDKKTADQWNGGALLIKSSLFFNLKGRTDGLASVPNPKTENGIVTDPDQAQFDESVKLLEPATKNQFLNPALTSLNTVAPNWAPTAGSPALVAANASTPPTWLGTSDQFIGAVGADDWTEGWTSYPEN